MQFVRRVFFWGARASILAWLAAHFALTVLYCFPNNPLKLATGPLLGRTIGTYFAQNWSLFAPNPIQANESLLVKCLSESQTTANLSGDGWNDITTPLFARHQQNRLTAYDRISRTHTNFMKAYLHGGAELQLLVDACRSGDKESCDAGDADLTQIRARSVGRLVRVASSYCREPGQGVPPNRVAIRIRDVPVTSWSRRGTADPPKAQDIQVGVFPIDAEVATLGVWKEGG